MSGADTSVPTSPAIEVCKIGGLAGVEIPGVDLSRGLDESTFKAIEDVYNRHPVVVMRDQRMTPAQHVAFSHNPEPGRTKATH